MSQAIASQLSNVTVTDAAFLLMAGQPMLTKLWSYTMANRQAVAYHMAAFIMGAAIVAALI